MTRCDDCVSREAVIKLFNGQIGSESALILHKIKKLPSVQPSIDLDKHDEALIKETVANIWGKEPSRKGHRDYNDIYDHYLCSECKTIVMDYDNFCPNCGADMRGDTDGRIED